MTFKRPQKVFLKNLYEIKGLNPSFYQENYLKLIRQYDQVCGCNSLCNQTFILGNDIYNLAKISKVNDNHLVTRGTIAGDKALLSTVRDVKMVKPILI